MRSFNVAVSGVVLTVLCALGATPLPAQDQSTTGRYIEIGYMKVEPERAADYVRLEREVWKPIHEARAAAGIILSWRLYAVRFPGGADTEYGYATVAEYANWAKLEHPYGGVDFAKVHPKIPLPELLSRTTAARKMVRQDILAVVDATGSWNQADAPFLELIYVRAAPGQSGELDKVEREFFKPFMEDLVKAGWVGAWSFLHLKTPGSLERPYTALSLHKLAKVERFENPPEKWAALYREVAKILPSLRARTSTELWEQLDRTAPR